MRHSRYYEPYLDSLVEFYSAEILESFDRLLLSNSNVSGEAFQVADSLNLPLSTVEPFLERLASESFLERVIEATCVRCGNLISQENITTGECLFCDADLSEDDAVNSKTLYRLTRPRNRDSGWIVATHGMSSYGPWQEELQWLIDGIFPVTLPFRNFKYGNTRFAPFSPWGQSRKLREFRHRWHLYNSDLPAHLAGVTPDIIAHSFGTWLIGHLLLDDPSVRVGYVITLGSILRPDFNWARLIERGQVQAVLNHYGAADSWVPLAQFVIPDAGPSGIKGFLNPDNLPIYNLREERLGHSDFFDSQLAVRFKDVWRHFLQGNADKLANKIELHADCQEWRPIAQWSRTPSPLGWLLGAVQFIRIRIRRET